MTTYHVLNENTLGYVDATMPEVFGVLAGKLQLGGHDWISGPVSIAKNDVLRSATLEDFAFFRVDPTSHIN